VISPDDAERLIHWLSNQPPEAEEAPETAKGFNLVTVAYYFGAMLMISACAWFLGDKWEVLGPAGVLVTCLVYFALAAGLGWWLREKGYMVGGGLLITVAVCLTPLIVFSIERLTGWWPPENPGGDYRDRESQVRLQRIVVELSTMAVSLAALLWIRFAFLIKPLLISFFAVSMEVAAWYLGDRFYDRHVSAWVSVGIGAVIILFGFSLDRVMDKTDKRSEDFAFWTYLFGLLVFWGALTWIDSDSEMGKFIYLLISVGFVVVSLWLRRSVFLVFGALGMSFYLYDLAYTVFKDSVLFPFVLAFLGLAMIVATVFGQKYVRSRRES